MAFVSLKSKNDIGKSHAITLEIKPEMTDSENSIGEAINFLEKPPLQNKGGDIIFHFNPRPNGKMVLNTFLKGKWQNEVTLEGKDLIRDFFSTKKSIEVTLKLEEYEKTKTSAEKASWNGKEFSVFLNREFLTNYQCPLDLTKTCYIGFTPGLRVKIKD